MYRMYIMCKKYNFIVLDMKSALLSQESWTPFRHNEKIEIFKIVL